VEPRRTTCFIAASLATSQRTETAFGNEPPLIKSLGAKFTPELKGPNRSARLQVETVFGSQELYAQALIDDYKAANIAPKDVFAQSFNLGDVLSWIRTSPSSANKRCSSTMPTRRASFPPSRS
jgi:hypothetical protein